MCQVCTSLMNCAKPSLALTFFNLLGGSTELVLASWSPQEHIVGGVPADLKDEGSLLLLAAGRLASVWRNFRAKGNDCWDQGCEPAVCGQGQSRFLLHVFDDTSLVCFGRCLCWAVLSVIASDNVVEDALRNSSAGSAAVIRYRDSLQSVERVRGGAKSSRRAQGRAR